MPLFIRESENSLNISYSGVVLSVKTDGKTSHVSCSLHSNNFNFGWNRSYEITDLRKLAVNALKDICKLILQADYAKDSDFKVLGNVNKIIKKLCHN